MDIKMSIAVPTHQVGDNVYLFKRLLDSLWNQSFQDFEIVVTDNSEDDEIERVCDWYRTGIRYFKNPKIGMAQNTNEAIRRSRGSMIKILYMDDFMAHDEALMTINKKFKGGWLVTDCTHTYDGEERFNPHHAKYSEDIHTGHNTIGSPSVLTIENKNPLMFDEGMTWLLDCDYYHRLYERYGEPTIVSNVNVVIGLGEHQLTNTMGEERKKKEHDYITKKYQNA